MRILVTGGAGFVGRRVCKYLLEAGHEVVCVDKIAEFTGGKDPNSGGWLNFNPLDYKNFKFLKIDCRDFFKSDGGEFGEVYHLAAMVGGRTMIENYPLAVGDDLSIDSEYWQYAKRSSIAKTIYFSSSASYPVMLQTASSHRALKEEDINFNNSVVGMPDLSYGWAKLTGEFLGKLAYERHGLESVVYRPFSGYGEDQDLEYPFPSICKRALDFQGGPEFFVWGSGKQMRDFIYIDDCINSVMKTKDLIKDGSALNLSTGIPTSFIDLAKSVLENLCVKAEVKGILDKPEGVFARYGSIDNQRILGMEHKVALIDGIKIVQEYFASKMEERISCA